jgi:hypothetical protein
MSSFRQLHTRVEKRPMSHILVVFIHVAYVLCSEYRADNSGP